MQPIGGKKVVVDWLLSTGSSWLWSLWKREVVHSKVNCPKECSASVTEALSVKFAPKFGLKELVLSMLVELMTGGVLFNETNSVV